MDDRNLYGHAVGTDSRGKHADFGSALEAALGELLTEHDPFFDSLPDVWRTLYPKLPARPGRYESGVIYLYVRNSPTLYMLRPSLPAIKRRLMTLPGAPKRMQLRLEIHS